MENSVPKTSSLISEPYYTQLLFTHLLDHIKEYAIFMLDCEGVLRTWNVGVKRLLGYEEQEFIGKHFSIIFTKEDKAESIDQAEMRNALEKGSAEDERWHQRKDGSVFWASGLLTRVKDDSGEISGYVKIMRDRSEQKNFEMELAANAQRLEIANKELKNFAGIVSHDLSAPLQSVLGFASIASEKSSQNDPEVNQSIGLIVENTKRMISLVREVLDFSTTISQDSQVHEVSLETILADSLSSLSVKIAESNALVTHDDLPTVAASEVQLSRVFQNLIENSLKFARPETPPKIHVSANDKGEKVEIQVADNGVGIATEDLPNVFTLFERANKTSVEGRGIGLASCKKIIEHFGGNISVRSKIGIGTVITFTLPKLRAAGSGARSQGQQKYDSASSLH